MGQFAWVITTSSRLARYGIGAQSLFGGNRALLKKLPPCFPVTKPRFPEFGIRESRTARPKSGDQGYKHSRSRAAPATNIPEAGRLRLQTFPKPGGSGYVCEASRT